MHKVVHLLIEWATAQNTKLYYIIGSNDEHWCCITATSFHGHGRHSLIHSAVDMASTNSQVQVS